VSRIVFAVDNNTVVTYRPIFSGAVAGGDPSEFVTLFTCEKTRIIELVGDETIRRNVRPFWQNTSITNTARSIDLASQIAAKLFQIQRWFVLTA